MSELNETVNVSVDDATVITVPLVTNLTATNAAPTAKTVGDALASKVDEDEIMAHVTIKVNDEESDNQGKILIDGTGIPISEGSSTTIADAVEAVEDAVEAKTASNIQYSETQTIKAKIDEVATAASTAGSRTAADITYDNTASTPVSIKAEVDALKDVVDAIDTGTDNVKYSAQTGFDDTQKGVARNNIGAAAKTAVDAIQSEMNEKYSSTIPYNAINLSDDYPLPPVDLGLASRLTNSCALYRFGALVLVTFCFQSSTTISAGTKVAGFYGGYECAANMLVIAQITANDGSTTVALYRDGDGVATPLAMPAGFWRGFILYGLNSSLWPIAT